MTRLLPMWFVLGVVATAGAAPPPRVPAVPFEQKLASILRLEDQRVLRDVPPPPPPDDPADKKRRRRSTPAPAPAIPDLTAYLKDPEARVRRRAALAVGRVGVSDGVEPLSALLRDADPEVRAMAAFALGLIGDVTAGPALRTALSEDADARVQGRAAEALGLVKDTSAATAIGEMVSAKIATGALNALAVDDLSYPLAPDVEAARLGMYALVRLRAWDPLAAAVLDASGQPRVTWWPVAYALQRMEDARAVPALMTFLRGRGVDAVAFAARGLGQLKEATAVDGLLALLDPKTQDVRVVAQAVRALGQIGDRQAVDRLMTLLSMPELDGNVRLEVVTALGAIGDDRALEPLFDLVTSRSPTLRGAALIALASIEPTALMTVLSSLDPDSAWSVRADLATALGRTEVDVARPRLMAMLDDADQRVVPAVLSALVKVEAPDVDDVLMARLTATDFAVRASAASLLGERKVARAASALQAMYTAAKSDGTYAARAAALEALAALGLDAAGPSLRDALADKDWALRRRAADLLTELDPQADLSAMRPAPTGREQAAYESPSVLAPTYSPQVYLETAKGTIRLELAVLDAPLTSWNFIALARRGAFNGLTFHRVVPNFVVQDGDPRGDGEGGPGYTIRDEINDRPYLRGTLGMALAGPDSGGSQYFITHGPQPHLDARYTVFGHVVEGMDVVDRLERGDRIERVRVWDGVEMKD